MGSNTDSTKVINSLVKSAKLLGSTSSEINEAIHGSNNGSNTDSRAIIGLLILMNNKLANGLIGGGEGSTVIVEAPIEQIKVNGKVQTPVDKVVDISVPSIDVVENENNTEDDYKLDITDANGTFTTPNLMGRQGIQGIQGERGEQGETGPQGQQGIQGVKGDKGDDGYPFLIYKQYEVGIEEFNESDFPEIGLMFMIHVFEEGKGYPVYRYTADGTDTPYSFVTYMNTEGIKGEKGDRGEAGAQGIAGLDGKNGADGITPHIDATTKHWFIGDTDTGVLARGKDGANGYSPTATITKTETKSILTVTDINGTTSVDVSIDPVEHTNTESGIEDTPVGHIIPYMGNNAPAHYLVCDGTEYNIADYPYLVQHFQDEFGSSNFFGGNGTTTFAVPDLRGEFLRGTGVNYHTNQGSGADVGVHQDATKHNTVWASQKEQVVSYYFGSGDNAHNILWGDHDSVVGNSETAVYVKTQPPVTNNTNVGYTTSRPTNTSVLYCIKYEPTYFMQYTNQYAGFNDTVLFDGDASAVGSYTLADDITNYDYILVEIASGHSNTNFFPASNTNGGKVTRLIKVSDIHIASKPKLGSDQFLETQWYEAAKPWYYFLSYWFISSTQFWIDEIYYSNLLNPRIKKITGIKGGA